MRFDQQSTIKEYVKNISDADLSYIGRRLLERMDDDLGEAINTLSHNRSMDEIFRSAHGAVEIYQICDYIRDTMYSEADSRGMISAVRV
jgi:hypothetical protein